MIHAKGHGQYVKSVGPFAIRCLFCNFMDQVIYGRGPCLSWLVPWSVNGPRSSLQKDLGQNVKGAWSISHKVPVLQLYGPGYLRPGDHVCSGLFLGQLMAPGDFYKRTWSHCQMCLVYFPQGACPETLWIRLLKAGDHAVLFPGQLLVPGHLQKRIWSGS